jgi:hypothetical protein
MRNRDNVLKLFNEQGQQIENQSLLQFLRTQQPDGSIPGASIRWAITVSPADTILLELQTMPTQAGNLTKPSFKADNSISVLLAMIVIRAEMFDGRNISGPVPVFFANDRESALDGLITNPEQTLADISLLNSRFLRMEHINQEEVIAYLKKGKHRPAKGKVVFSSPNTAPLPAKRARRSEIPISETGEG